MEITAVRRKKHTKCAVPAGANFLQSGKFQNDLILLVGSCCLSGLIRGLENLELPERERFYSFRLYEKNQKYPRGLRTSGLRGAIQISARYEIFAEMTGVHHVTGCAGHCNLPGYRR